jgi:glycosyltransferase involved in cell wall biosynthesis
MRVGVMLSEVEPQAGGGHTFEREIFAALLRLESPGPHTFQVFTLDSPHLDDPLPPHVHIVTLPHRRRLAERVGSWWHRATRFASKTGRRERRSGRRTGWRERMLLAQPVDLMWYPSPVVATTEIPFITVVWDLQHRLQPFFPEVSAKSEWELRERYHEVVLRRATIVIAGTEVGRREIERFYQVPPERIRVLPHPTPQFAFESPTGDDAQVLAKCGIHGEFLLYPAQFWPHKNHVALLKALRLLRDEHGFSPQLALVGSDKGNRAFVETAARDLGVAAQVVFPGFVSQHELVVLYRNALALAYVTYFGPENLPPLEAMAAGCPVVASNVPGSEEQLGDAALRVDPRDAAAIAAALYKVRRDPNLRQTLIARGQDRARRFRPDHFVRGVVAILDELEPVRACWGPNVV